MTLEDQRAMARRQGFGSVVLPPRDNLPARMYLCDRAGRQISPVVDLVDTIVDDVGPLTDPVLDVLESTVDQGSHYHDDA